MTLAAIALVAWTSFVASIAYAFGRRTSDASARMAAEYERQQWEATASWWAREAFRLRAEIRALTGGAYRG